MGYRSYRLNRAPPQITRFGEMYRTDRLDVSGHLRRLRELDLLAERRSVSPTYYVPATALVVGPKAIEPASDAALEEGLSPSRENRGG